MSNLHHVKVYNDTESTKVTHVEVDGIEIHNISSLDIEYRPTEIPQAIITLRSISDISGDMMVKFNFEPYNIRDCIKYLALQLQFDEDFRKAWQSSIYSALVDLERLEAGGAHTCNFDKAGYILDRLVE